MASSKPATVPSGPVPHGWMPVILIGCCALLLACMPGALAELRYERAGLAAWQLWRVLTAHFVHLNTAHLLYNFLGLALIYELLWADLPVRHGIGLVLSAAFGISGALWWLQPGIAWYAGSSGVLHGLWSGCALAGCLRPDRHGQHTAVRQPLHPGHRHLCVAALVVLALKLHGDLASGDAVTIGAGGLPVVPSAHFYGALMGAIYVMVWRWKQYCRTA